MRSPSGTLAECNPAVMMYTVFRFTHTHAFARLGPRWSKSPRRLRIRVS